MEALYYISSVNLDYVFWKPSISGSTELIFNCVNLAALELHFPRSPPLRFSVPASPMRSLCEFGNLEGGHEAAAVACWSSSWLEIMSGEEQTEVPAGSSVFYSPLQTILPSLCPAPFSYFCLPCVTVTLGPPADATSRCLAAGAGKRQQSSMDFNPSNPSRSHSRTWLGILPGSFNSLFETSPAPPTVG